MPPPTQYLPLKGNRWSDFHHHGSVLPIHELLIHGVTQSMICVPLPLSSTTMTVKCICVVECTIAVFLSFYISLYEHTMVYLETVYCYKSILPLIMPSVFPLFIILARGQLCHKRR